MTSALPLETAAEAAPRELVPPGQAPGGAVPAGPQRTALGAVWQDVLDRLAHDPSISRASFATWLRNTRLVAVDGGEYVVGAQHGFARQKLERDFRGAVERAIALTTRQAVARVRFTAIGQEAGGHEPNPPAPPGANAGAGPSNVSATGGAAIGPNAVGNAGGSTANGVAAVGGPASSVAAGRPAAKVTAGPVPTPGATGGLQDAAAAPALHPRHTFGRFVVTKESQFACAAARAVAENPGLAYNPLFVYGGAGLGKTHLLQAIGHHAQASRPGLRVIYVVAGELIAVVAAAASEAAGGDAVIRRRAALRAPYAEADLLLVDDVQALCGKGAELYQEDMLGLINAVIDGDRQLVLAADRPPRTLTGLDERLRSRLQMGLVADLAPLELESRLAVLRARVEARGVSVPAAVLEHVARRTPGNVRALDGALTQVIAASELTRAPLTLDGIAAALGGAGGGARARVTPERVLRAVAEVFGVEPAALTGKRRDKETALARQVAMYLLREETGASLAEIGACLGGRDHTTVRYGYAKIEAAMARDPRILAHVEATRQLATGAGTDAAGAAPAGGEHGQTSGRRLDSR